MELFYQEGPSIILQVKDQGHDIFLDLKLHDIPNTVKSAMKGLARLGVDLVNVQCIWGGKIIMEQALEGLEAGSTGNALKSLPLRSNIDNGRTNAKEQGISTSLMDSVLIMQKNQRSWS